MQITTVNCTAFIYCLASPKQSPCTPMWESWSEHPSSPASCPSVSASHFTSLSASGNFECAALWVQLFCNPSIRFWTRQPFTSKRCIVCCCSCVTLPQDAIFRGQAVSRQTRQPWTLAELSRSPAASTHSVRLSLLRWLAHQLHWSPDHALGELAGCHHPWKTAGLNWQF